MGIECCCVASSTKAYFLIYPCIQGQNRALSRRRHRIYLPFGSIQSSRLRAFGARLEKEILAPLPRGSIGLQSMQEDRALRQTLSIISSIFNGQKRSTSSAKVRSSRTWRGSSQIGGQAFETMPRDRVPCLVSGPNETARWEMCCQASA